MAIYIKNCKYDINIYKKENYYVAKKYYIIYKIKKEKYTNYKKILFKYIIDNNFLF